MAKYWRTRDRHLNFLIDNVILRGNIGAPAFVNQKVVGMIKGGVPSSDTKNLSRSNYPYFTKGIAVKSSVILSVLRKLQQQEQQPGFN